jgi:hypothetical protein
MSRQRGNHFARARHAPSFPHRGSPRTSAHLARISRLQGRGQPQAWARDPADRHDRKTWVLPSSLPNVIMNRSASAVKLTGMPWPGRMVDGWWNYLATSSRQAPSFVFLEAIWTRLLQRGFVDVTIFGEDLEYDIWHPFLDVRFNERQGGWEYRLSATVVAEDAPSSSDTEWSPVFLSESQFTLVNLMCRDGDIDLDAIAENSADRGALESDIIFLEEAGLAGRDLVKPNTCRLLTSACQPGIPPDGRFFAGENVSGRVSRWTLKQIKAKRPALEV